MQWIASIQRLLYKNTTGMIVEYGLAQVPGHRSYRVEDCDHFSVCKPPDQNHPCSDMLLQFLEGCREVIIVVQFIIIGD
jgi:hypothetical protein